MQEAMDFYQEDFERQSHLKVHDIMNVEEIEIYRDDSVDTALRIMKWEGLAHACVFDHSECLVGIINYNELLRVEDRGASLNAYMHEDFQKIYGHLDAEEGIRAVSTEKYHCLPVFENKKIIGILNYENLFDARDFN